MTSLERLKIRIPEETNTDVLKEVLETSKDVILNHLYPLNDDIEEISLPRKYKTLLLDIAVEIYNKRGAEGEVLHDENGVKRTYQSAFVSSDLLKQIVPYGKVVKGESE